MNDSDLSRRRFLSSSGVLVASIILPCSSAAQTYTELVPNRFNDRIEIRDTGRVHIHIGRIEMGQGLNSAIAQLAAEELDIAVHRIIILPVDTASAPNEGFTDSSASMHSTGMAVRRAAASARAMLLALAARHLNVPIVNLNVEDGTIRAGVHTITYWQLATRRIRKLPSIREVPLKSPVQYRLIGREIPRIDLSAKITGSAVYVQDLHLADMLHARVIRPPGYGAKLDGFNIDINEISIMQGVVQVVRNGSFLAVVAEREEQAIHARERLRNAAHWNETESMPGRDAIFDYLCEEAGMSELTEAAGQSQVVTTYQIPYRMHGSIGPSCAIAHYKKGYLTIWSHAQGMYPLRNAIASLVGLPVNRVRCIHVEGSGCYGHNGADDAAADAALIAFAIPGRPVRLQWMRDDEHRWEPYGPAMVIQVRGEVNNNGRIAKWNYAVASPTHSCRPGGAVCLLASQHIEPPVAPSFLDGLTQWAGGGRFNADPYYDVTAHVEVKFVRKAPLRSSALRSLGAFANVFAIEGFMDDLARAAGKDPLAFRLDHLSDPRARAVLEATANKFGWSERQTGTKLGYGLGFARLSNYGAYLAVAAEVESTGPETAARLVRIVATVDCGEIINPDGVRNQIEGGIVQASSWTLLERVDFDQTRIINNDWISYPILRITDTPEIDIHMLDKPGEPYLGIGEAAHGPTAAAIANAFSCITGRRHNTLPLTSI